jgi:hypothetical protein
MGSIGYGKTRNKGFRLQATSAVRAEEAGMLTDLSLNEKNKKNLKTS